jgi:acylphosphatase
MARSRLAAMTMIVEMAMILEKFTGRGGPMKPKNAMRTTAVLIAAGIAGIVTSEARVADQPSRPRFHMTQTAQAATPAATVERAVSVVISGKVQRVNYRNWTVQRAKDLKVRGWVKNAPDKTVHALFGGTNAAVTAMLDACRTGPSRAEVKNIEERPADPADVPPDFRRLN